MRINNAWILLLLLFSIANFSCNRHSPDTVVEIRGSKFYINGVPTYKGKTWNGNSIDGLLFNSRMVQGIFDDENPETRDHWRYPDTGEWDPERNTDEFRVAMEEWYRRGILAFTLNMQGGSPTGYDISEVLNSAFRSDGSLKPEYMARLDRILERSDDLGMVVILGLFYFGQDQHLSDEQAVINAVDNTLEWLIKNRYRNVILEINNECDVDYDHQILQPGRVHELIERVKQTEADGYRLKRINEAEGDVARFNALFTEYQKAPEVTRRRIYIETMQAVMPNIASTVLVDDDMTGLLPLLNLDGQKGQ